MQSPQPARQTSGMNFFNQLPPSVALVVGLVGGLLVLCSIGFFVLLSMMLKGQGIGLGGGNGAGYAVAGNQPTNDPSQIGQQPTGTVPPLTASDHIRGDKNAPLTLIVYSDYECPFCKSFHPTTQQILSQYAGKVKLAFRHYPLSFHANAQKQAEAGECIAELGGNEAFWNYTDKIFERTTSNGYGFALDKLPALAAEVGVNQAKFKTCLDSGKFAQAVQDSENAAAAAGVQGTPGSFLIGKNGSAQLISGAVPLEQFKAAIDAALK